MPSRAGVRRARRVAKDRSFRLHKPEWIDPYPQIPGTKPEKRIFEALVKRGIFFVFQGDFSAEEKKHSPLLQVVGFKPDFIVPEYRVILDPFGDFAHTQPDALQRDFIKLIYYEAIGPKIGYEFIHKWSTDVERYGGDWFVSLSTRLRGPKLQALSAEDRAWAASTGYRLGENLGLGATGTAAANRARARPKAVGLRRGRGRRRTAR